VRPTALQCQIHFLAVRACNIGWRSTPVPRSHDLSPVHHKTTLISRWKDWITCHRKSGKVDSPQVRTLHQADTQTWQSAISGESAANLISQFLNQVQSSGD
jgi:hypothetical protein